MDRVGVEPTTSGLYRLCKRANDERELKCSNSTQSTFSFCLPPSMYTINRNFEELAKAVKTRQKVWTVLVLFSVWQNVAATIELVQPIVNVLISKYTFSCYLTLSFMDFLVTGMATQLPMKVVIQHFLMHEDVTTIQ
jgi:hypothetical protein